MPVHFSVCCKYRFSLLILNDKKDCLKCIMRVHRESNAKINPFYCMSGSMEFATKCFSSNLGLKVSTGIILNIHNITYY